MRSTGPHLPSKYVFFLSHYLYRSLALQWRQAYRQHSKRQYLRLLMTIFHALLPVQHVPAMQECASSMAARMPSGMDDEVEAEANRERLSDKALGSRPGSIHHLSPRGLLEVLR
jgi:hypothetical protein